MEVSSANHAHPSQARRDLSELNPILPSGYVGGNEKKQVSLSQVSVEDANNKKKLVDFAVV
jgi:hypothetical protein